MRTKTPKSKIIIKDNSVRLTKEAFDFISTKLGTDNFKIIPSYFELPIGRQKSEIIKYVLLECFVDPDVPFGITVSDKQGNNFKKNNKLSRNVIEKFTKTVLNHMDSNVIEFYLDEAGNSKNPSDFRNIGGYKSRSFAFITKEKYKSLLEQKKLMEEMNQMMEEKKKEQEQNKEDNSKVINFLNKQENND